MGKRKKRLDVFTRAGVVDINDVLDYIGTCKTKEYFGRSVKMKSQRYELFKAKGVNCVKCGLKGEFFALEKQTRFRKDQTPHDTYHFNLYGYNEAGEEVMLTKDHILPKSKGGDNHLNNYQTMCCYCNWDKGDIFENETIEEKL